jgi:hypothetical protein
MANIITRREVASTRPFYQSLSPDDALPPGNYCGIGEDNCIMMLQRDPSTKEVRYSLFDIPPEKSSFYFPELVELAKKLNDTFEKEISQYVKERRSETKDESIEVSVALVKGQAYLTYTKPIESVLEKIPKR